MKNIGEFLFGYKKDCASNEAETDLLSILDGDLYFNGYDINNDDINELFNKNLQKSNFWKNARLEGQNFLQWIIQKEGSDEFDAYNIPQIFAWLFELRNKGEIPQDFYTEGSLLCTALKNGKLKLIKDFIMYNGIVENAYIANVGVQGIRAAISGVETIFNPTKDSLWKTTKFSMQAYSLYKKNHYIMFPITVLDIGHTTYDIYYNKNYQKISSTIQSVLLTFVILPRMYVKYLGSMKTAAVMSVLFNLYSLKKEGEQLYSKLKKDVWPQVKHYLKYLYYYVSGELARQKEEKIKREQENIERKFKQKEFRKELALKSKSSEEDKAQQALVNVLDIKEQKKLQLKNAKKVKMLAQQKLEEQEQEFRAYLAQLINDGKFLIALGVGQRANHKKLKKAFQKISLKLHPDMVKLTKEEDAAFKKLNGHKDRILNGAYNRQRMDIRKKQHRKRLGEKVKRAQIKLKDANQDFHHAKKESEQSKIETMQVLKQLKDIIRPNLDGFIKIQDVSCKDFTDCFTNNANYG